MIFYWAGALFDTGDLLSNLLLGEAVSELSGGRYQLLLPQNGEGEVVNRSTEAIRDADFVGLFSCDGIIASFNGTELDSGTVTEFCFAKMLDLPAVLLRTDFRHSGDQLPGSDPWNLMCSNYPRTESVWLNGMELYHRCVLHGEGSTAEKLSACCRAVASPIVAALDRVTAAPGWLEENRALECYKNVVRAIGGSLPERLPKARLRERIAGRLLSGSLKNSRNANPEQK